MRRRHAFTLVELLVVIGIIVLLASLILVAVSKAIESARCVKCQSNMRQILLAVHMYTDANRGYMPIPAQQGLSGYPRFPSAPIWMTAPGYLDFTNGTLWPYIGNDPLSRQAVFNCPSDTDPRLATYDPIGASLTSFVGRNFSYAFTRQLVVQGKASSTHPYGWGLKITQIRHPEHKIIIFEPAVPSWIQDVPGGGGVNLDGAQTIFPTSRSTRHSHQSNVGMADGHVELLDASTEYLSPPPGLGGWQFWSIHYMQLTDNR